MELSIWTLKLVAIIPYLVFLLQQENTEIFSKKTQINKKTSLKQQEHNFILTLQFILVYIC